MRDIVESRLTFSQMMRMQGRILVALMLRDIKSRFFGNAAGFLVSIAWPLSHIFILLTIYSASGLATPYGDSSALWFATGVVPFQVFNYMSRYIMMGIVLNRPMLAFPVVKVSDILFSRAILELLNAGVVIITVIFIFALLGIDFTPIDPVQAFEGIGANMLLGLGFGIVNGVIAGLFPMWMTGFALFQIIMWIASGVLFVPDAYPATVRHLLALNPALQGVEWVRSAYYEGFGSDILDKGYMVSFAVVMIFLGLALERLLRGKIMQ